MGKGDELDAAFRAHKDRFEDGPQVADDLFALAAALEVAFPSGSPQRCWLTGHSWYQPNLGLFIAEFDRARTRGAL